MKKAIVLFVALALILVGCSDRPPVPKLTAGNIDIPVVMGSYSWKSFAKHVVADAPGPADLLKGTTPVSVEPGAEVLVKFSPKPDKLIWSRWAGNETVEQVELDSNKLTLPEEKGVYIYSIRAVWGTYNSGMYAFIVKVE